MSKIEELINQYCPDGVKYVPLGTVAKLSRGQVISKIHLRDNIGDYPVYSSQTANNGELGKINTYTYDGKYLTWTTDGAYAGTIFRREGKFNITNVCGLIDINKQILNFDFTFFWLSFVAKDYVYSGMGNPKLMSNVMSTILVPIPPLPIQEKIAKILDKFSLLTAELEAELDLQKKRYDYYRNRILSFDSEPSSNSVQWRPLGEVGPVRMCKRILKNQTNSTQGIPFYKIGTFGGKCDSYISPKLYDEYRNKYPYPKKGDILISAAGTIGKAIIFDGEPSYFQDSNIVWIDNDEKIVINKYLFYCYQIINWKVDDGGVIKRLYNENLRQTIIPIPPLAEQERIVNILDRFEALVTNLSNGLPAEIERVRKQYEYYRNKLLTFPIAEQ